jgi:hypothetical protein
MSAEREEPRIVRSWLKAGVTALPDRVLDAVLDQLPATPQRRAGWLATRLTDMNPATRFAMAAVVVVAAAAVTGYALINSTIGTHPTSTVSPNPSAATAIPVFPGRHYEPGRYFITGGGVAFDWLGLDVSASVPPGWMRGQYSDLLANGIQKGTRTDNPVRDSYMNLSFWMVDNVLANGCTAEETEPSDLDPPVGPTVDDLASALIAIPGVEATQPLDVMLDGWKGKRLALAIPSDCRANLWRWDEHPSAVNGWTMMPGASGEHHELWILDVAGRRLLIDASYRAGTLTNLQSELLTIVDSIEIDPRD